jgi:demethylmenaquinone methyltransferase/2-methoxy-6-polyprenyl-1,4-benzoquinol methylase
MAPPTDSPEKPAETTHFGYQDVSVDEKAGLVKGVFDSVASRYDIMNDLMSGGLHRLWKRYTIQHANARPGQVILDLAGGTGDLAREFARIVGERGRVVLADINAAMLEHGRRRLVDAGIAGNVDLAQVDAEALPFADNTFDRVSIAFGLRNVTDQASALAEMHRVLKPGGKVLILEFSRPSSAIKPAYDLYSFKVLPLLGKLVARDPESYRYLAESIRMHPDQETLLGMMEQAGFERAGYENHTGGIVAIHRGYKL